MSERACRIAAMSCAPTRLRRRLRRRRAAAGPGAQRPSSVLPSVSLSTQDKDHAPPHWGDPHLQPPPRPPGADEPPAAGASFLAHQPPEARGPHWQSLCFDESGSLSTLATSDLEFGSDALTGSTLETPEQQAHARARQVRPRAGGSWGRGCAAVGRQAAHARLRHLRGGA